MSFTFFKFNVITILMCLLGNVSFAKDTGPLIFPETKNIKTIKIQASGQRYEPLHNITPIGPSRHVSDYELSVIWSPSTHQAREDWRLKTIYPFDGDWSFSAVYDKQSGHRTGRDGFRPSTEGAVAAARNGAVFKDLWLSNPIILAAHADSLPATHSQHNGNPHVRQILSAHGTQWEVLIDKQSGHPMEISTRETDPLDGEVINKIVFSDWRDVSGIPFPFKLEQFIDNRLIRREIRQAVTVNPEGGEQALKNPATSKQSANKSQQDWGWSMSQFFLRRAAMGAPADEDQSVKVSFKEVGKGIYQVLGSSHHNLLIEGPDGLAIVDAVWYPRRSRAILEHIYKRWPDKPLKYVILTHHHPDHTGGLAPFAEAGAIVVTAKTNEAYFQNILSKTTSRAPNMIAIENRGKLEGIGRNIEVYDIPNSHAHGVIAVYVPDAKLLFNTDLYSPGRKTQSKLWTSELLRAIEFHGIDVKHHVGGHGMGSESHENFIQIVHSP